MMNGGPVSQRHAPLPGLSHFMEMDLLLFVSGAMLPNEDKECLALTLSTCLAIRIDSIDFQLSVSMVSKDNGPVYVHFLLL